MAATGTDVNDPRPLKISIAGIRGAAGTALTAELAMRLAAAFGTYLRVGENPPAIVLSRDTRPSGPMLAAAVRSALLATGCDVIDLGICPTPVMQQRVRTAGSHGGLAITAGHGPEHWNALKFVGPDGVFLDAQQGVELLDHFHHNRPHWVGTMGLGTLTPESPESIEAVLASHRAALLELVDRDAIRSRRLRVAADLCNGACCNGVGELLAALDCEPILINDDPAQPFPHPPEPTPQTMSQLRALVGAGRADVGFCFDADGDRLGVVTDRGEALSPQYTLALAALAVLPKSPGVVVTNLSTSRLIDYVAALHGSRVERVRVGQSYIAEGVHIHGAVLGGEGSGGIMYPEVALAHDSLATMAQILDLLAGRGRSLGELTAGLPRYAWREIRLELPAGMVVRKLAELRESAERGEFDGELEFTEGLRIAWPDSWVHVRSSITEPVLRIVAEADAREVLDQRLDDLLRRVQA